MYIYLDRTEIGREEEKKKKRRMREEQNRELRCLNKYPTGQQGTDSGGVRVKVSMGRC